MGVNGAPPGDWWRPGYDASDETWLAPVAPYVEPAPARTEEEARREPRRGDRWRIVKDDYTLLREEELGWWVQWSNGDNVILTPGEPHETYLGNFAHELEAP